MSISNNTVKYIWELFQKEFSMVECFFVPEEMFPVYYVS